METSTPETTQPSTVLVVDDERGPRLALQLILQREFRVLTAQSGEEGIEKAKAERGAQWRPGGERGRRGRGGRVGRT